MDIHRHSGCFNLFCGHAHLPMMSMHMHLSTSIHLLTEIDLIGKFSIVRLVRRAS